MSNEIGTANDNYCSGGVLPGEAISFYDPNNLSVNAESGLIDTVLSRPPAYGLSGWDLVLAELRSAGFDDGILTSVASQADIGESSIGMVDDVLTRDANLLTRAVKNKMGSLGMKMDRDVVLASAVMSASSHRHDRKRQSGGSYYLHPMAVAKIIGIAWSRHMNGDEIDLQMKQSLGLLHDSWENMFSKSAVSFMYNPDRPLITPFSYSLVLGRLGVSEVLLDQAKRDLLQVTKQPSVSGKPQDYELYIDRMAWTENAATAKIADIHHNYRLDPKPVAFDKSVSVSNSAKRVLYSDAPSYIKHSLNGGLRTGLMLGYIERVTHEMLRLQKDPVLDYYRATDLET